MRVKRLDRLVKSAKKRVPSKDDVRRAVIKKMSDRHLDEIIEGLKDGTMTIERMREIYGEYGAAYLWDSVGGDSFG